MAEEDLVKSKFALTNKMKDFCEKAIDEDTDDDENSYMESGIIGLDLALTNGKGIPMGSSVLLWATPGCGKTTLLGDVARRMIMINKSKGIPFKVLYIATEASKQLLQKIGLKEFWGNEFLYVERSLCWREIETFYESVLKGSGRLKDVKMIIIDSLNNVLSDQNVNKSIADGDFGTKAKERGNFYSKYLPRCSEKGVTSFFIAQARNKQDAGMMEAKEKAAASWADLHNVEIILKCGKKQNLTDAAKINKKTIFGDSKELKRYIMTLNSCSTGCKNRFFDGTPSEVLIEKGSGAINTYTVRKLLEGHGFLKNKSGWYMYEPILASTIGCSPEKKMRVAEVNDDIVDKMDEIVTLLKSEGKYKLEISEEEVDMTEEELEEEE